MTWVQRDGTEMEYADMGRHHAWNAARMMRRNGRKVPIAILAIADENSIGPFRAVAYHAWNVLWLLAHPWKIDRCTLRGI